MSLHTIATAAGVLLEAWDDVTRTHIDYRTTPATVRPYTAAEDAEADARAAAATAATNERTLRERAGTALAGNATFLAIGSPTNAQTLAQVRALTRQVNALIRLEIRALSETAGT